MSTSALRVDPITPAAATAPIAPADSSSVSSAPRRTALHQAREAQRTTVARSWARWTKAEVLEAVAHLLESARVLPQVRFTVGDWRGDRATVIERIAAAPWSNGAVIVRSSARAEDSQTSSLAGRFDSVLDVRGASALEAAIDQVAASYAPQGAADAALAEEQIFVQPMLEDLVASGVFFTRDPNTNGDYLVINYTDSADTTAVTAGKTNALETLYHYRYTATPPPARLAPVLGLARELEQLLGCSALDCEFAVGGQGELYLLQVRRLCGVPDAATLPATDSSRALTQIHDKVARWCQPHPHLHGERTVFGVMPDWNPAEIIGVRPRPLALSLYKELVTDGVWAYQRHNYGYRNLRGFPLMMDFCGLPYIDVRVSFNSFVPSSVRPDLAERLVNYYVDRLIDAPNHHDKVEFEIIFSCYTLDLPERLDVLRQHGFSQQECLDLAENLRALTNGIINGQTGLWKVDTAKIEELDTRRRAIGASKLDPISRIYWLLEDCKRYGTLPFAGLARAGFIAVQLLRSLVTAGVLSHEEYHAFMENLDTVSSEMSRDLRELPRSVFLERYGHLRPGTYDILSPRYDEAPDRYFDWSALKRAPATPAQRARFSLSLPQLRQVEKLLVGHGLDHGVLGLFDFIKGAIEGREYAKFIFTRSVSDVLSLLRELGEESGLSAEDTSFIEIDTIRRLYGSCADPKDILTESVAQGRKRYEVTRQLMLPPLITSPEQVWSFQMPKFEPNYITQRSAMGRVSFVDCAIEALRGSILMIPSADPGFDWIFSHGIAGFITMYGGANSHMAIRAGELGIPAVIGAGEVRYSELARGELLEIDCANRQVRRLR